MDSITRPRRPNLRALPDEAERERLLAHWLPTVYSWCARLGCGRIDAEEAAHDVLMVFVQRQHTILDPDALPGWLFGACRRVVSNHRRRVWWQRWLPGVALERWASPDRTDAALDERELAARVERALAGLSDEHREVLILCYFEDRSIDEAGAILGVPAGTVKSRLYYARGKFQARFEREEG
ncbi:MAG: sigma-70 family RNA polymerase sigma factor [Myxococcota bacterium]